MLAVKGGVMDFGEKNKNMGRCCLKNEKDTMPPHKPPFEKPGEISIRTLTI